jgi:glucose/arabinose dehydrogenase
VTLLLRVVALVLLLISPWVSSMEQRRERSGEIDFVVEKLADGLGVPWGLTLLSSNELLISERAGKASILSLGDYRLTRLSGLPDIMVTGQGGLLDVVVPDDYVSKGWIYFTYSKNIQGQGVTTLARTKRQGNQLVSWQDLLITRSATNDGRHFGGRMAFDGKGHLFFSVGDRGHRPNGQDLRTHAGSILRVNLDGTVPDDNPFVGKPNALPEIWSYGFRNPQGLVYDKIQQQLWLIEHGPRGGDEINWVKRGSNYGWPVISYGKEYWGPFQVGEGTHKAGMEQPVKVFTPSIAPASLLLYSGKAFPQWKGSFFSGALKLKHLNRVQLDQDLSPVVEDRLLQSMNERIRAVIEDGQGRIIFSTDSGKIMRIRPVND